MSHIPWGVELDEGKGLFGNKVFKVGVREDMDVGVLLGGQAREEEEEEEETRGQEKHHLEFKKNIYYYFVSFLKVKDVQPARERGTFDTFF